MIVCPCKRHHLASKYPYDQVPIQLFKQFPDRKNTPILITCIDCRDYFNKQRNDLNKKSKEYCQENNIILCSRCNNVINELNITYNINGEVGSQCTLCKNKYKEYCEKSKIVRNEIKYELIEEHQCSCELCQSIFIIEEQNLSVVVEIPTYIIDDVRLCDYKGKIYTSLEFIHQFKNQLIYGILEYDHLLEHEQRESGILLEGDIYEPKIKNVSDYRSKENIKHEGGKCKLLCSRCHMIETIKRQDGKFNLCILERSKRNYIRELKKTGCINCLYVNEDLLRFFNFDHLDPSIKIADICVMMRDNNCTFDEMIEEIKKTQILCRFCHYIVTQKQIKEGLLKMGRKLITNH